MNASEQQSVHAPTEDTVVKARAAKPRARGSRPSAKPVGRTRKPKLPSPSTGRKGTKTAKILALLGRADGASLKELKKATGWQAHSVRVHGTEVREITRNWLIRLSSVLVSHSVRKIVMRRKFRVLLILVVSSSHSRNVERLSQCATSRSRIAHSF
jgi:hypothetical protein